MRTWPSEELIRWASRLPDDCSVLEIGCGNGCNLQALPGFAVGLDLAVRALRLDRTSGTRLVVGTALLLPFLSQSLQAVADVLCTQHLNWLDHYRVYQEVLRVLRPGGRFFSLHWSADNDLETLEAIFPNLGTYSMADVDELEAGLSHLGFDCTTELVTKTYKHRTVSVQYLVLDALKR